MSYFYRLTAFLLERKPMVLLLAFIVRTTVYGAYDFPPSGND